VADPDAVFKKLEDTTNEGKPLPVLTEAVRSCDLVDCWLCATLCDLHALQALGCNAYW